MTDIDLTASPETRVRAAIADLGEREVVDRAIALLAGFNAGEDFLLIAGGKHAQGLLDGAPPLYWPEVWGARVLLTAWAPEATEAITAGLQNQAWRVREMCARVVGVHAVPARDQLIELLTDDVARVRAVAARALGAIGTEDDVVILEKLFRDPEVDTRRAAQQAITAIRAR